MIYLGPFHLISTPHRLQVICNMPFLMVQEGHKIANQSAPEERSNILVGLNTSLRGLRKI